MRQRLIGAIICLLIAIPLVLNGGIYLKIGVSLIGMLAIKEVLNIKKGLPLLIKYISYILVGGLIFLDLSMIVKIFIIIFTLLILLIFFDDKKYNIEDAFYLICFSIIILLLFSYIYLIREKDINTLIYLFLITIFTDTFAFISGKLFGRHKLIERISPNKTLEGFIIGSIIGTIVPTIFYIYVISPGEEFISIIIFTFALSIIGQFGDLVFSSIKRHYKIKDFSNLIPGHGGILDRLDSITFVMFGYIILINLI